MFKKNDPYTFKKSFPLQDGGGVEVGTIALEYLLTKYDDVELPDFTNVVSVVKNKSRRFLLSSKQRIFILNPDAQSLAPTNNTNQCNNYPVIVNPIVIIQPQAGMQVELLDYAPKTINTQIQSTGSVGGATGTTSSTSKSNTVGSSTTESNSYGASVSYSAHASLVDVGVSDSVTANYEHTTSNTTDKSNTTGSENSNSSSKEASNTSSMSMKDWGAYSIVNQGQNASWIFGQEYPWDAVLFRDLDPSGIICPTNPKQKKIVISDSVNAKLTDGNIVFPASHLSSFGVNFVMNASWLITIDDSMNEDEIVLEHYIEYYTASHLLNAAKTVDVFLDTKPIVLQPATPNDSLSTIISLSLQALDPIGTGKPAIVGFIPNKFIVNPIDDTFAIAAAANTILVKDNTTYGAAYPKAKPSFVATEAALTATFLHPTPITPLSIVVYFKIIDSINDYKLYLKNWVADSNSVMLTFTINEDTNNPIVKYVNAMEATGGEGNLLTLSLRNLDFSSIDYHDYLQLGLNSIQIDIRPNGDSTMQDFTYLLRALSIEKS